MMAIVSNWVHALADALATQLLQKSTTDLHAIVVELVREHCPFEMDVAYMRVPLDDHVWVAVGPPDRPFGFQCSHCGTEWQVGAPRDDLVELGQINIGGSVVTVWTTLKEHDRADTAYRRAVRLQASKEDE